MRGARTTATGWLTPRGALLLVLTSVAVGSRVSWCDSVELHLTALHEALSLNQPVLARISLRNTAADSAYLSLDANGRNHVNVNVRAQGNSSYVTADDARTCVDCLYSPVARGVLGEGEEVLVPLVLDRWHRFEQQGEYEVYVELQRQAVVDIFEVRAEQVEERNGAPYLQVSAEDVAWLEEPVMRSNTLTITIGPRDQGKLRSVANDLLSAAKARDYSAGHALAWMVDVVAVPALAELIDLEAEYEAEVYAGIMRTASPEAVDVLLGLSPPDGPLSWDRVRSGLERIASSASADPVARRAAEQAILRELPNNAN